MPPKRKARKPADAAISPRWRAAKGSLDHHCEGIRLSDHARIAYFSREKLRTRVVLEERWCAHRRHRDAGAASAKYIEALESGAIDGEIAEAWKEKLTTETLVKGCARKQWRRGGYVTCHSECGLTRASPRLDQAQRGPRDPSIAAMFGKCLLRGIGGPQDNVFGVMNVTQAAELGRRAYFLGYGGCVLSLALKRIEEAEGQLDQG